MDQNYKRMTDFLVGIGIEDIPHTQKSYLAHLIAVFRLLEAEGCRGGRLPRRDVPLNLRH